MNITALTLAVLLAALSGCKPDSIDWPKVVSCGAPAASSLFSDVMNIVTQDGFSMVFTDASVTALEDMAKVHGPSTIACVLDELLTGKIAPRGVDDETLSIEDQRRARRIATFLEHHSIKVSRP